MEYKICSKQHGFLLLFFVSHGILTSQANNKNSKKEKLIMKLANIPMSRSSPLLSMPAKAMFT